ncbi:MAG: carbohydrate-binding domain-containing protein [Cellulomonadaceae bacterium]|jgi:hypothetical protein|nr:carbohydrate-binding domain-containing protein [Cellulomonadaceae bacterium]
MSVRRPLLRTLLTLGVAPALLLGPLGYSAHAVTEDNIIDLQRGRVKGVDWSQDESVITVKDTDGDGVAFVVVRGMAEDGTRIVVADNTKAIIELDGVNLNLGLSRLLGPYGGINIGEGSELTLQLAEGSFNSLIGARSNGPSGGAGVYVPATAELTIEGLGDGSGQLSATGYVAMAGIGSGRGQTSGTINIKSGHVTALGGDSASGIGSGFQGKQGPINISGGVVTATAGKGSGDKWGGAGIGSGSGGNSGPIVITGGTVRGEGAYGGAGIGAGHAAKQASAGVNIYISGGDVTGIGSGAGAGIGTSDMLGGTTKNPHQIVASGLHTSITAQGGSKEGANAIGLGDKDSSSIQTFIAVGGGLNLDGKEVKPNLTLKVGEGHSSGAVILEVPKNFTSVKNNKLRLANGLAPEVQLAVQTTLTTQPLKLTAKGFEANPESMPANALDGNVTILFEPSFVEPVELPDTDAAPARTFLAGMSDSMLLYVGMCLGLCLTVALVGAIASTRRAKYHQSMAERSDRASW